MKRLFFSALLLGTLYAHSQEFNPKYNRDSIFNALIVKAPEAKRAELTKMYQESEGQAKDFIILILNSPRSSKQELINNITKKRSELLALSKGYNALVPAGYTVFVEFNPADDIFTMPATIDLHIYGKEKTKEDKGYQLKYGSPELKKQLKRIGWTEQTLEKAKQLLATANCISIQNGAAYNEIGFARSGMGKYGMLLAPKPFNAKEISEYSDDCHYIYYENYLILTYAGGAVGPDCFPD